MTLKKAYLCCLYYPLNGLQTLACSGSIKYCLLLFLFTLNYRYLESANWVHYCVPLKALMSFVYMGCVKHASSMVWMIFTVPAEFGLI